MKVREGLAAGDYRDPGWYKHPPGTVAYEVERRAGWRRAAATGACETPEWKSHGMTARHGMPGIMRGTRRQVSLNQLPKEKQHA